MWSEELLEQVQLNFSFQNKFIILHPCGRLVDKKTHFQKYAFLKFLLAALIVVVMSRKGIQPTLV